MNSQDTYTFEGAFDSSWDRAFDSSTPYFMSQPGESEMDDLLISKLGIRGWGRFNYFKQKFSGEWGERKNKPFSPKAASALQKFLELAQFAEGMIPSIFLTEDGHLELAWEDNNGHKIQVEFGNLETEVYLEANETEGTFPNEKMESVLQLVG